MMTGGEMTRKILIFGNSGSGKSFMSKELSRNYQIEHLDLDTVTWKVDEPGIRLSQDESRTLLLKFITDNDNWVIEGCYGSLITIVAEHCNEMRFLNPGIEQCLRNNISRPWEPHKYPSPEAQMKNLSMLQDWVQNYESRDDEYSLYCHRDIFNSHKGEKAEYKSFGK